MLEGLLIVIFILTIIISVCVIVIAVYGLTLRDRNYKEMVLKRKNDAKDIRSSLHK